MSDSTKRVQDILTYIEQVEKLNSKPAFAVSADPYAAFESELRVLPELRFNLQSGSDDVWLRIPRLQEIAPPPLDDELRPWVTLSKSPTSAPVLKSSIPLYDEKKETGRLEIESQPEIQAQFAWYLKTLWQPWSGVEVQRRKVMEQYRKLFALHQHMSSEGAETPLELAWGNHLELRGDEFACERRQNKQVQDIVHAHGATLDSPGKPLCDQIGQQLGRQKLQALDARVNEEREGLQQGLEVSRSVSQRFTQCHRTIVVG